MLLKLLQRAFHTRNLQLETCPRLRDWNSRADLSNLNVTWGRRAPVKVIVPHPHACLSPLQWLKYSLLSKLTIIVLSLVDKNRPHFSLCLLPIVFLSIFIYFAFLPSLFIFSENPEDYLGNEPQRENKNDNKARGHAVNKPHCSFRKHALKAAQPC